jgi:hypothetical protein
MASLGASARGVFKAVRAFAHAFGDKGAPPAPEAALPESYGDTRVVLMVVDPKTVFAYWDVAAADLETARENAGASAPAVLRFHGNGELFDVEVDLAARNWYVPLWSAGKSYSVELGLKGEDGSLCSLAKSNPAETPPSMPTVALGERFLRVETPARQAEAAPPPPVRKPPAPPPFTTRPNLEPPPASTPEAPAQAPVKRPALTAVMPLVLPPKRPAHSAPLHDHAGATASDALQRRLEELHELRGSQSEPAKPAEPVPSRVYSTTPLSPAGAGSDLTTVAEAGQAMGLSSAAMQERRPEP